MTRTVTTEMNNPKLALLIKGHGAPTLAREMGVSSNTVYTWIAQGYVPARRIVAFCNALDMDLGEAFAIAVKQDEAQTKPEAKATKRKPEGTLETLVEVQRGNTTIEEAAEQLGVDLHSLQIAYAQNEHRLFLLYSTLTAFSEGRINATEAAKALDVTKTQLYYLMRTYGVSKPERATKVKPVGRYTQNKVTYEKLVLDVIANRTNAKKAAEDHGMSERTLHRYIKKAIEPFSLTEISHWPVSFRLAFANEIENSALKLVEKWVSYARKHGLVLEKRVRRLPAVKNWREVGAQRILIAVLQGEATLDEVVELRKGARTPLIQLFDGVLKGLGLRYAEVANLPVVHQMAIADLLTMIGSHYRRSA